MVDMNRLAWLSYINEFRWSKIKKNWQMVITGSVIYLYILFSYPSLLMDLEGVEFLFYLIGAIPMVITSWTMTYSGIRLPKLMFMGPMTEDDRRCYLQKVWDIRFWLPNVLMIAAVGVRAIFQPESLVFGLLVVFQNILLSYGIVYAGITSNIKLKEMKGIGIFIGQWLIGMVAELILLYYYASQTDNMMKFMMVVWGILLLIQLPMIRKLHSYKQQIFDYVIDYEKAYVIQDKKEVRVL